MKRLWHRLFGHGDQVLLGVVGTVVTEWCDACERWVW